MATVFDSATGITTTYYYDLLGRALYYTKADASGQIQSVQYTYDEKNNLSGLTESVGNSTQGYTYNYDPNNRITSVVVGDTTVTYEYDAFSRLTQKVTKQGETVVKTEVYTFADWIEETDEGEKTYTSMQVASYAVTAGGTTTTWTYTYDANGNILTISDGTHTTSYVYDSANQLVEEYNEAEENAHFWVYDNAGNIKSRTEYRYENSTLGELIDTVNYTYGDTGAAPEIGDGELPIIPWSDETATNPDAWGDLLTNYNGNAITYDGIGNPLTWGSRTFTWEHGRQLASLTENGTTWTYTYGADGLRTSRTNGTKTYTYTYNGSQLVQMTVGTNTLRFTYDAAGTPLSVNYNGTIYYYVTNIQGDVVAIVNASGVKLVEYTYSSWGVVMDANTTTSEMLVEVATILENINPLLYRGYVYDTEAALYYLQSRYYDPTVCRFINADALVSTGQGLQGNNMFAYCLNRPVSMIDEDGYFGLWALCTIGAVVGGLINYAGQVIENYSNGKTGADAWTDVNVGEIAGAAFSGAVSAIPGSGVWGDLVDAVGSNVIEHGVNSLVYGNDFDCNELMNDIVTDCADNLFMPDLLPKGNVPKFIRDIKDEARELGVKGTKKLQTFLNISQVTTIINNGFYDDIEDRLLAVCRIG